MITTKEQIRNAAARLFRKRGYRATSMRDIAEAVDIKAASIYNHFKSKQEILQGLLMEIAHQFEEGMQQITKSSLPPNQKMERVIALHIRLTIENTDSIALIASEWVHLEDPVATTYLHIRNTYEEDLRKIIEAGKESGVFQNADTEIILFSVLSTLRWLYSWYSKNKNYNQIELEQQLIQCLIGGINAI